MLRIDTTDLNSPAAAMAGETEGAGAPRILRAVGHKDTTFLPGHENRFTTAIVAGELSAENLTRLTQTEPPVLAGDWASLVPVKEPEAPALPSIRALPEALAQMTDVDAIAAMRARDDRKSADVLYAARLSELDA